MTTLLTARRTAALAGTFVVFAAAAVAQPRPTAAPTAGTLAATAEGASMAIRAGGSDRNPMTGNGCSGYIANGAPLVTVQHTGGPLSIYVTSGTDTTLLVADPAGRWQCSDDATPDTSNPGITIDTAAAGTYAVWVGTFSPDAAGAAADLHAVRGQPRW